MWLLLMAHTDDISDESSPLQAGRIQEAVRVRARPNSERNEEPLKHKGPGGFPPDPQFLPSDWP